MATNGFVHEHDTDGYWLGYLSGTVAYVLGLPHLEAGRETLKSAMDGYMKSPACPPKGRQDLKARMKGER